MSGLTAKGGRRLPAPLRLRRPRQAWEEEVAIELAGDARRCHANANRPRGLPDCCPHRDDDGKTLGHRALALGMATVLRDIARRMARAAPTTGAAAALAVRLCMCRPLTGRSKSERR